MVARGETLANITEVCLPITGEAPENKFCFHFNLIDVADTSRIRTSVGGRGYVDGSGDLKIYLYYDFFTPGIKCVKKYVENVLGFNKQNR